MNDKQYFVVRAYLGIELLEYCLNFKNKIDANIAFGEINFSQEQLNALQLLYDYIKKCKLHDIHNDYPSDGFDILIQQPFGNFNIFNYCNKICNGQSISTENEDPLTKFVIETAINKYPLYLARNFALLFPFRNILDYFSISNFHRPGEFDNFAKVFREDILHKLTNNNDDIINYNIELKTSMNLSFNLKVVSLLESIICSAFKSCHRRGKYDLLNFLVEIKESITKLRNLFSGEEVTFSAFVSIAGLSIGGLKKIVCANNITLWPPINPSENRAVIEITYPVKIESSEASILENCLESKELYNWIEDILMKLRFAICFTLDTDYGFAVEKVEQSHPLSNLSYRGNNNIQIKSNIILESDIENLTYWYNRFAELETKMSSLNIAFNKLDNVMHEIRKPEYILLDSMISLESLFSGPGDATFKVIGSILKLLNLEKDDYTRLKRIYKDRSHIVHGRGMKETTDLDVLYLKKMALQCLKSLLHEDNEELLNLNSDERIENLIIFRK